MSTTILYHLFQVPGVVHKRFTMDEGAGIFDVELKSHLVKCPSCGSRAVTRKGSVERVIQSVPSGGKPIFIRIPVPRVHCLACGALRQAALPFADERDRMTRGFKRYILDLCRIATISDVSKHLGLSWDTVKDIQKEWLGRKFKRVRLKDITHIGIDEISVGKGHKYLTTVMDFKTGAVVFVGDGKGADALAPFWASLKASRAKIAAVSMDMSQAFIAAVRENLPGVPIVFDRFHLMRLVNEALDNVRRRVAREGGKERRRMLKGKRWLLLKNVENLDKPQKRPDGTPVKRPEGTPAEMESLSEIIESEVEIGVAYILKEQLRRFWTLASKADGEAFLEDWTREARDSQIPEMARLADTLSKHSQGIAAWFDFKISNGPVEGTNNKIQTMKRMAYGYRDMAFLKLKIMGIHMTKYKLVG